MILKQFFCLNFSSFFRWTSAVEIKEYVAFREERAQFGRNLGNTRVFVNKGQNYQYVSKYT